MNQEAPLLQRGVVHGRVGNYKCKDCARHFTGEIVEEDE
jgi:transposase-like protein